MLSTITNSLKIFLLERILKIFHGLLLMAVRQTLMLIKTVNTLKAAMEFFIQKAKKLLLNTRH